MNPQKPPSPKQSDLRTLGDVIAGADLFLGLSGPGVLSPTCVAKMTGNRSSLRWPTRRPKSCPRTPAKVAPDAIIATGRSDYPNQVNNVLCFPFIFRGALDVGATDHQRRHGARPCIDGIAASPAPPPAPRPRPPIRASS